MKAYKVIKDFKNGIILLTLNFTPRDSRQAGVIGTWPERRNDLVEQLRSEALEVERHGENEIWKWQDYRLGNTEKHSPFLLRRP